MASALSRQTPVAVFLCALLVGCASIGWLFRVRYVQSEQRPAQAHVAIPYLGYWFYIDRTDQDTKATFSLLMELARLELTGKTGPGPVLTLPVGGR